MILADFQQLVKDRLAANSFFAGLDILLEFDSEATADQLAAAEKTFEAALASKGVVLIILSPFGRLLDQSKDNGLSLAVTVPVALCENIEVNHGSADPAATPPRAPFGQPALRILEEVIKSLIAGFKFPAEPFQRPELGTDGLLHYYLLPEIRHRILAAA